MRPLYISLFFWVGIASGCLSKKEPSPLINTKLNTAWLDDIIHSSDSVYTRPYFRTDFATASYYYNTKDSSVCNVMKDSAGHVRQVITETKGIRNFYAQFYPNGQATGVFHLNDKGQLDGKAVTYYADGKIKSKGAYKNGLYAGTWISYDENGRVTLKEEYNENGQNIKTITY